MTPIPDTSPPFTLHVEAPDTPDEREWLTGWCHCLAQPLIDGQLLPDPWIWPSLGATDGAWRVLGPWPERLRLKTHDDWIISAHGQPPVRARFSVDDGFSRFMLTIPAPFMAYAWVQDELLKALKLLRFIRPGYRFSAGDPAVLEPVFAASNKSLLDSASRTVYWRVQRCRMELRRRSSARVAERDRQWLDSTIHTLIDEELRRGLLHPNAVRSSHVMALDELHTPLDRLSVWERPPPHMG